VSLRPVKGLFQLPAINNVAIEDQILASILLKKSGNLFGFGALGAQVYVRDDNSFVVGLHYIGFNRNLGLRCKYIMFRLLRICFDFGIFFG
jgi:hypothetical protein